MKEKSIPLYCFSFLFILLTFLVSQQITRSFDLAVMERVQRWANPSLDYGFSFFTLIGSIEFSSFAVMVLSWYLYRQSKGPSAFLYLFFFITLSFLELVLKNYVVYTAPSQEFDRNRIYWQFLFHVQAPYSFSSGHTFRSVFLLGMWHQELCRLGEVKLWQVRFQKLVIGKKYFHGINVGLLFILELLLCVV